MGGLLSKFGLKVPFFFAAGIAIIGVLLTLFFLKEKPIKPAASKKNSRFTFLSLVTQY
jgi:hypothetical protein